MHAGYPWLPEPKQQGATTAAMSEAAQAAAQSPNARAAGPAGSLLPATPAELLTDTPIEALHKATVSTGAEGERSAATTGAVLGSGGVGMDALQPNTPYTPPSAGRGSESGVSTSEPSSLGAADRLLPAHPNASALSQKQDGAVLQPDAQVTPLLIVSMAKAVCQVSIR